MLVLAGVVVFFLVGRHWLSFGTEELGPLRNIFLGGVFKLKMFFPSLRK